MGDSGERELRKTPEGKLRREKKRRGEIKREGLRKEERYVEGTVSFGG